MLPAWIPSDTVSQRSAMAGYLASFVPSSQSHPLKLPLETCLQDFDEASQAAHVVF